MRTRYIILTIITVAVLVVASPVITRITNNRNYAIEKVNEKTNYETLKRVENDCRIMVSSYENDKLVYEQYKDSIDETKLSYGENAKMRANKTAITYNQFILKNSFIWEDAIPVDIQKELPTIK